MNNEKKKLIVVIALAVVIVSVGAFQFLSSGPEEPAPKKEAKKASTNAEYSADQTEKADVLAENAGDPSGEYSADNAADNGTSQLYAMGLPARDPFESMVELPTAETPVAKQPPVPKPAPRPWRNPSGMNIPPMPPMDGNLNPIGNGDPNLQLPQIPQGPQYSVSGVIRGSENAVVISDAQGNQRLIKEGQDLDGDHKVVSVQKNKVVIRKKDGKTITLNVGGNP